MSVNLLKKEKWKWLWCDSVGLVALETKAIRWDWREGGNVEETFLECFQEIEMKRGDF